MANRDAPLTFFGMGLPAGSLVFLKSRLRLYSVSAIAANKPRITRISRISDTKVDRLLPKTMANSSRRRRRYQAAKPQHLHNALRITRPNYASLGRGSPTRYRT